MKEIAHDLELSSLFMDVMLIIHFGRATCWDDGLLILKGTAYRLLSIWTRLEDVSLQNAC